MTRSQYKNCIISASGELNQLNGQWKPIVSIFWKNTTQKCHSISDLPGSFETENESILFVILKVLSSEQPSTEQNCEIRQDS